MVQFELPIDLVLQAQEGGKSIHYGSPIHLCLCDCYKSTVVMLELPWLERGLSKTSLDALINGLVTLMLCVFL